MDKEIKITEHISLLQDYESIYRGMTHCASIIDIVDSKNNVFLVIFRMGGINSEIKEFIGGVFNNVTKAKDFARDSNEEVESILSTHNITDVNEILNNGEKMRKYMDLARKKFLYSEWQYPVVVGTIINKTNKI